MIYSLQNYCSDSVGVSQTSARERSLLAIREQCWQATGLSCQAVAVFKRMNCKASHRVFEFHLFPKEMNSGCAGRSSVCYFWGFNVE